MNFFWGNRYIQVSRSSGNRWKNWSVPSRIISFLLALPRHKSLPYSLGCVLLIEAGSPPVQHQHSFTLHFHPSNTSGSRVSLRVPAPAAVPHHGELSVSAVPSSQSEIWGAACSKNDDCLSPGPFSRGLVQASQAKEPKKKKIPVLEYCLGETSAVMG